MSLGPLDWGKDIRKKFQCKSFKWFLENIYPEMFVPHGDFIVARGEFKNPEFNGCIDTMGEAHMGAPLGAYYCHGNHGTQEFVYSVQKDIRVASMDFDGCIDRGADSDVKNNVHVWRCGSSGSSQKWFVCLFVFFCGGE